MRSFIAVLIGALFSLLLSTQIFAEDIQSHCTDSRMLLDLVWH